MTSRFETPNARFTLFERLSDDVIAHVLPRGRPSSRVVDDEEKPKTLDAKKAIRREQCRANQARYRTRQRILQRRLGQSVQVLHEEVQSLKLKRERLRYGEKTLCSPWVIVTEVFHLLQSSFRSPWHMNEMKTHKPSLSVVQKSVVRDVAMGDLVGVDALLEQLRRFSLYFEDPQLHLQRVEELVPGVLTASAALSVTVSEFTLRCLFPHLDRIEDDDKHLLVRHKLLHQRLDCSCTITFLMDEQNGRVARLETNVDWMGALMRLLGNVKNVADVLGEALISVDGVVGDLNDHPGCKRTS